MIVIKKLKPEQFKLLEMRALALSRRELGHRTLVAPSSVHSLSNCVGHQTCLISPVGLRHPSAKGRNPLSRMFISVLLAWCRPSNIPRFVMPIRIYAINRMVRRWFPTEFRKKFPKRSEPELDTASAIIPVVVLLWVFAALLSIPIGDVFGRELAAHALTVNGSYFTKTVSTLAAARFSRALSKICRRNDYTVAARASAVPLMMFAFTARIAQDRKTGISQTCEIAKVAVRRHRFVWFAETGKISDSHSSLQSGYFGQAHLVVDATI
jgi:hypothetical protein